MTKLNGKHYEANKSVYNNLPKQPIELITKFQIPFCEGNILKYLTRYRLKGGIDDLNKILTYVDIIKTSNRYCWTYINKDDFEDYAVANNFNDLEYEILICLYYWMKEFPANLNPLNRIKELVFEIIEIEHLETGLTKLN